MDKIEIKVPLSWLLSVVKNLKKVSHNIREYENYLDSLRDWTEAKGLSENRKYIESLEKNLSNIISNNVEFEIKLKEGSEKAPSD
jgi:CRISPR/Cas system Type II protein with McrA/HNH and RuvC-like nuclease domain